MALDLVPLTNQWESPLDQFVAEDVVELLEVGHEAVMIHYELTSRLPLHESCMPLPNLEEPRPKLIEVLESVRYSVLLVMPHLMKVDCLIVGDFSES